MEGELRCPACNQLYCNPLLLPCSHNVCSGCACNLQETLDKFIPQSDEGSSDSSDCPEIDKLSIVSETDSGVVCNSRPNSYVGTPSINNIFFQSSQGNVYGIRCPVCKKVNLIGEKGYQSLPKNKVLETIVHKYGENKQIHVAVKCQLCENESSVATVMCEQCEVFYCDACRDNCHPSRGPLAKHNLVDPAQGKSILRSKNKGKEAKCLEHTDEQMSMYCLTCKLPMCITCHQDGQHISHEVQALGQMAKAQKTELSQLLQAMSEKARSGTEFIHRLKSMSERVNGNCLEFEAQVVAQCDALVEAIKQRKQELLEFVSQEKEMKIRVLKDQVVHCTSHLQQTTGLLHFCIEVLKESDLTSFLQISSSLINRVTLHDQNFNKVMELAPRVSPEFELTLDNSPVLHTIQTMNFFQMKAPGRPTIVPEECSAENNSVTISWRPYLGSVVEAYSLELDDGNGGDFRVVYMGRETICTVDGLHFNSIYNARIKAHNHAGESEYSDLISLQTAEFSDKFDDDDDCDDHDMVTIPHGLTLGWSFPLQKRKNSSLLSRRRVAWFTFDPLSAPPDIIFTNNNLTATCNNFDHRVILGGVGFSKGIHYWEVQIDRYENNSDPAIGIARFDVDKFSMLGKEDKGWSMYIDDKRSWFLHHDEHSNRTDGGIHRGGVVGVLLDLDQHTLSYFVGDEPHGPIAFTDLHGVYFPAVSINRNVQVTIRTGLEPPIESDDDDEADE